MAGETTKTTNLTNAQAGIKRTSALAAGKLVVATDSHAFSATETQLADVLLTDIRIPSNAVVREIKMYNDDLDSHGTPTLVFDIGVYAAEAFTSTTSGTDTKHAADAIVDADLFVDGDTTARAATTKFTSLALDPGTMGPDDIDKPVWELLGYDNDPNAVLGVAITAQVAAATGAAGDLALQVEYVVN